MTTRRIQYGTPCEFRTVTHGQLEHFDNKPRPLPLDEPEPAVKPTEATKSPATNGSEDESMRQSDSNTSAA